MRRFLTLLHPVVEPEVVREGPGVAALASLLEFLVGVGGAPIVATVAEEKPKALLDQSELVISFLDPAPFRTIKGRSGEEGPSEEY